MNEKTVSAVIVTVAIGSFFLVPSVYWFNFYRATPPSHNESVFSVWRSLGCETLGIGVTMTSYGHAYFDCNPNIPTGATAERISTR